MAKNFHSEEIIQSNWQVPQIAKEISFEEFRRNLEHQLSNSL